MLYGRQAETERIETLLADARAGEGRALLVVGDPGVGKTALLAAVARGAGETRQLRTVGLEAESALPFSSLSELTEGLRDWIGELPAPQAAAVEGALALGPPAPGDRFAVCAGFLGLLTAAATEQPVLVVVDDTQWLDPASAECVGFAARRLDESGSRWCSRRGRSRRRSLAAGSSALVSRGWTATRRGRCSLRSIPRFPATWSSG